MITRDELKNFKSFVKTIEQSIYGKKRRIRRNNNTNKTTIKKPNEQMALGKEKQREKNIPSIDTKSNEIKKDIKSETKRKIFNSNNQPQEKVNRLRQLGYKVNS